MKNLISLIVAGLLVSGGAAAASDFDPTSPEAKAGRRVRLAQEDDDVRAQGGERTADPTAQETYAEPKAHPGPRKLEMLFGDDPTGDPLGGR